MPHIVQSAESLFIPPPPGEPKGGEFIASITIENPEVLKEWFALGDDFEEHFEKFFGDFIFEVHKYLIRVTPIDTGALRGGWTSWLDKNNIDYSRQLYDISIAEKAPGRDYHFDPSAVEEGKTYSGFEAPTPLDITILNSVPYGIFLEVGTSKIPARNFVELTRFKAESWAERLFHAWTQKIYAAGGMVEPDPAEEIVA